MKDIVSYLKQFVNINQIGLADTFLKQCIGLMFKKDIPADYGLWFDFKKTDTITIHTFFMRFNINILLFNDQYELIWTFNNVKPWQIIKVRNVKAFLEMRSSQ